MSVNEAKFQEAVGLRVRTFREAHGISQSDLQRHARRHYGVTWSLGSIWNLEEGRLTLTIPALTVLAASLGDLTGKPMGLADLVEGGIEIELTNTVKVSAEQMKRILTGEPVKLERELTAEEIVDREYELSRYDPPLQKDPEDAVKLNRLIRELPVSLALERAAERLGVTPRTVQLWAFTMWNHSFDDEITARAGEDATAQKRGHATRKVVKEIQHRIGREHD